MSYIVQYLTADGKKESREYYYNTEREVRKAFKELHPRAYLSRGNRRRN